MKYCKELATNQLTYVCTSVCPVLEMGHNSPEPAVNISSHFHMFVAWTGQGGSIYITKISKPYKSELLPPHPSTPEVVKRLPEYHWLMTY